MFYDLVMSEEMYNKYNNPYYSCIFLHMAIEKLIVFVLKDKAIKFTDEKGNYLKTVNKTKDFNSLLEDFLDIIKDKSQELDKLKNNNKMSLTDRVESREKLMSIDPIKKEKQGEYFIKGIMEDNKYLIDREGVIKMVDEMQKSLLFNFSNKSYQYEIPIQSLKPCELKCIKDQLNKINIKFEIKFNDEKKEMLYVKIITNLFGINTGEFKTLLNHLTEIRNLSLHYYGLPFELKKQECENNIKEKDDNSMKNRLKEKFYNNSFTKKETSEMMIVHLGKIIFLYILYVGVAQTNK